MKRTIGLGVLLLAGIGGGLGCGGKAPPPVAQPVQGQPPATGTIRFLAGGDSRNDSSHVVPWAFAEAKARGASGFFFLGDMELTPELDRWFRDELAQLAPVQFFPVLGNHEIQQFGFLPVGVAQAEKSFRVKFLDSVHGAPPSALPDKVVYGIDLPGGVHFVALDNVTQHGFGADQMAWLADDLAKARAKPETKYVIVGMHKPLAGNGVSPHGMEHDGPASQADSAAALELFKKNGVSLILMSHVHQFAKIEMGGIPAYITGGLGAPLDNVGPEKAFHHFLQIDVGEGGLAVQVVKFGGVQKIAQEPETEED
jgi:3',5'-cyclic AMP phosphodiesterase CpdA